MKVIPHPESWLQYVPKKEMKNQKLGIFAHCYVKNGEQENIKKAYKKIVDIAIEENTCSVLSASQSLVLPNHNMLYEEWFDYDEFFKIQLKKTYRNAFYRWLDPIRKGPISPEFTRILYSSGEHPTDIAPRNAFALIRRYQIQPNNYDNAYKLLKDYIENIDGNDKRIFVNAHQSLNESNHFLLYEIWLDFNELLKSELHFNVKTNLDQQLEKIAPKDQSQPCVETFQIYYDPQKYHSQ